MEVEITFYLPQGVRKFLAIGSNYFIVVVDDTTVLKYPHAPNDSASLAALAAEARTLEAIGRHDRIIGYKGKSSSGLLIERTINGSVRQYLCENSSSIPQGIR
jgi:hypothetical protein